METFVVIGLGRFGSAVAEELCALGHARCAVVAFSDDIGNSVLITLNLKELGIPRIVCKARSASHEELLRRIGADQVVFPEQESGRNLAHTLNNTEILDYIELSEHYSIVKTGVPASWVGKSVGELAIRKQYKVNIVSVQGADGSLQTVPLPDYVFRTGDLIFSLGRIEDNDKVITLE